VFKFGSCGSYVVYSLSWSIEQKCKENTLDEDNSSDQNLITNVSCGI